MEGTEDIEATEDSESTTSPSSRPGLKPRPKTYRGRLPGMTGRDDEQDKPRW